MLLAHDMILLAIGANLPLKSGTTPLLVCQAAIEAIRAIPGLILEQCSPWYRTQAIPVSAQPDYCNGVARFAGDVEKKALLQSLQAIEARFERVRSVPNAARTLDLDIIDLNGLVWNEPDLVLPHPRAHERAFVLRPLIDVAPDWQHPVLHQNVATLLAALPPQIIAPWHESVAQKRV